MACLATAGAMQRYHHTVPRSIRDNSSMSLNHPVIQNAINLTIVYVKVCVPFAFL